MKHESSDFVWLINVVKKYIVSLCVILVLTIIFSSVVSLFCIEEKYSSSVIIYPTTTNSVSKALFAQHVYGDDLLEFGEEEATEQLLQVLKSDEIREEIVERFDLYTFFDIDTTQSYHKSIIMKQYQNLFTFKKTKFNAIEITVLTKNAQMSSDIANESLILLDVVMNRIRSKRARQALNILEKRKALLYRARNNILDSLKEYRAHGLISVGHQTERLTEQYAIALASNNVNGAARIKKELNTLANYVDFQEMLLRKGQKIENELANMEFEADRLAIDNEYTLENKFIINKAYPADKKSQPVRWLVVFSSLVAVSILSISVMLILESSSYFKHNG